MKTNIENLTLFCSNGTYGYSVLYKSGKHTTKETGNMIVLPANLHKFMVASPYSVKHCTNHDYSETIYYSRDIRTKYPHLF